MLKNLAKRQGLVPLLLGVVLLSAASYLFLFAPKLREVRRLQAEVRAREAEAAEALRAWGEAVQVGPGVLRRDEERVRAWRKRVPDAPRVEDLMEELTREAVRRGLRDVRIAVPVEADPGRGDGRSSVEGPGAGGEARRKEQQGPLGEIRLRVTFVSGYQEMASFVDALPRMQRLVAIGSLSVRRREGRMETTVDLSAYWREKP